LLCGYVRLAKQGNAEAFEQLVKRRMKRAIQTAYRVTGDWEEARDVAQVSFVKAWRKIGSFDESYPFDPWLRRIVTNEAIDQHRRKRARRQAVEKLSREQSARATRVQDVVARGEVEALFEEAARILPRKQRAVFVLREMEGLTHSEVAKTLGINESTVRNHLFKARKALSAYIIDRYPEYAPKGRSEKPSG